MSEYSLSLSMVTYNSERWIDGFFNSLKALKSTNYHLYVIDNGSADDTVRLVKKHLGANVTLIENKDNLGFGKAHNLILDELTSKYHLIINPDITMNDDVVCRMARYMDDHNDIGILTPKVKFPDGTLQLLPKKNPRLLYLVSRRVNLSCLKKYRADYEMLERGTESAFDIEFCTGAFMFVRTALLKKVGGFDDRYFMYFEDADLTREIRQFARAEYNPSFVVFHEWERAGSKSLKFFLIQIYSMIKYMIKWNKRKS